MPPPTSTLSHLSISDSSTGSFVDTFAPPTMAARGRFGWSIAPYRNFSSLSSSRPARFTFVKAVTPTVEACARCAVPKASFT